MNERVYVIEGMNCNHCRSAAQAALAAVEGVREASVTLSPPEARITGDAEESRLEEAVAALGFRLRRKRGGVLRPGRRKQETGRRKRKQRQERKKAQE